MTFTAGNIFFLGAKRRDIEPVASQGLMFSTVGEVVSVVTEIQAIQKQKDVKKYVIEACLI